MESFQRSYVVVAEGSSHNKALLGKMIMLFIIITAVVTHTKNSYLIM